MRLGWRALPKSNQSVSCKSGKSHLSTGQTSPPAVGEVFVLLCVSKSVYYSMSEEPLEDLEALQSRDAHPHSDGEQSPTERWPLDSAFCFEPQHQ